MTINSNSVAICMATYNGEKYIIEQIDLILRQTYQNWVLFIRDDNSTDNTVKILKKYSIKYPDKITIVENDKLVCKSAKKNFAAVLKFVTEKYNFQYFMFSDQDDIWLKDKVEKSLKKMKEHEKKEMKPYLLHTDLRVVDQNLKTLGNSFFSYRALDYTVKDIRHLLVQNNITGCTMLWNKKFNDLVNISDENVAMHDWWMAIVASLMGEIICINEPTILYRQHGGNVVGATNVNSISFIVKRMLGAAHVRETLKLAFAQAQAIVSKYHDEMTEEQIKIFECFIGIQDNNKVMRIKKILENGYLKQGLVQIIGEIIFI